MLQRPVILNHKPFKYSTQKKIIYGTDYLCVWQTKASLGGSEVLTVRAAQSVEEEPQNEPHAGGLDNG